MCDNLKLLRVVKSIQLQVSIATYFIILAGYSGGLLFGKVDITLKIPYTV